MDDLLPQLSDILSGFGVKHDVETDSACDSSSPLDFLDSITDSECGLLGHSSPTPSLDSGIDEKTEFFSDLQKNDDTSLSPFSSSSSNSDDPLGEFSV